MPQAKPRDKKSRRVTVSGSVRFEDLPDIEAAARHLNVTVSALVAEATVEKARRELRKAAAAAIAA